MQSKAFDTLYKNLNKAQKQAVDAIEGPVMVIAGPGTGKTTILTLRIANILKRTDTPANGILAITYTDAGVKAMRSKLQGIIGDRAHDVRIHTFHGFASGVIAEYPDHFLHLSDMKQMSDIEQETTIRSIISDVQFSTLRPAGKPDAYISGIIRSIDESKREALSPEMVRQHAKNEIARIQKDENSISSRGASKGQLKAEAKEQIEKCERTVLFADIYELYESQKKLDKKMDFNDLIIELLLTLRNDQLLLRLLQERYLYSHVDEHQDTNDAQNFIIGLIAEFFETPNIFIVGDEKQAIYRFQGASVENFLLLQKKWPAMNVISLDTNYRSHQHILDASFGMIEHNYEKGEHEDLRIKLTSGNKATSRPIEIVRGENISATEVYLVKELTTIVKQNTVGEKSSVAIIVRRNRDLDRIIRLLEFNGIPLSSERSVDIFNHPIGRVFFDLLEYLHDTSKVDSLAKTILAGMWDISFEKGSEIIRWLKSGRIEDKETWKGGKTEKGGGFILEKEIPGLLHIQRQMLNDGAIAFLIHTAQESGYISIVARDPSYIHVWRGIVGLAESLVRDGEIRDPAVLVQKLLAYRMSAESRIVKVSVGAPDFPIKAMTAHGSKGLEFDHVFIPYATEEAWVGRPRGASFVLPKKYTADSDIRDVRRLFYVALTRARKSVTILTGLEESDGKVLTPLRFINELHEKNVSLKELPRVGVEKVYEEGALLNGQGSKRQNKDVVDVSKLVHMTKQILLEKGLSVTALNHFIECPNKFIYQSILKIPQAPSIPAEKGTAMHAAISQVWKSNKTSQKDTEKIMSETILEYFNQSFLPILEKQSAQKELLESIPLVAKALESHFALRNKNDSVFTEISVRSEYSSSYNKLPVTIPLHGKLDTILDKGNAVDVFDYKTKRAMSVSAIKGETKSSDGNYFRQLIFYKLLIGDDARWRTRKITPALVFVSPDDKGRCPTISLPIEAKDLDRVKSEVQSLIDSVWSGKIAESRCSDLQCEWCGLRYVSDFR